MMFSSAFRAVAARAGGADEIQVYTDAINAQMLRLGTTRQLMYQMASANSL